MVNKKRILGLDIGNVILTQISGTSRDGQPIDGALNAIRDIVDSRHFSQVWLVSKCGLSVRKLTRQWLKTVDFWGETGIPEDHLKFCWFNSGKGPICKKLGVTHFVDDRPDVMNYLHTVDNLYAFRMNPDVMGQYRQEKQLHRVLSWGELKELLLKN